ncbi:hypothetical protein BPIT_33860 [Candidatus Brocadia pituitae]|nr:hypothetical protein BPIT_33860 [Candidatus Brocadia pituitae]
MEQTKVKYWYDRVYFAPSWSASLTIGSSGVTIKTEVADTVSNVVSSIESATSTVNAVGNELFPVIINMMIVNKVDRVYVEKWEKGKSDIQGVGWLLEETQESLKTLNLGSETAR